MRIYIRDLAYDLFMVAGAGLVVAGVAGMFGVWPATTVAGALVMALTRLSR